MRFLDYRGRPLFAELVILDVLPENWNETWDLKSRIDLSDNTPSPPKSFPEISLTA